MFTLSQVFVFSKMGRVSRIPFVLSCTLALTLVVCSPSLATTAVEHLESVFGTPEAFVANFETIVKDRSDQIIGLLIAAGGFVYAIRVFNN